MDDTQDLMPILKRLRMGGMMEDLRPALEEAVQEKWNYSQLLIHLFTREADRREHKKYCFRLSRSKLDPQKTFETFDFTFNRNVSETVMRELARCDFLEKHQNVFLVGPSGVGKTHLANAIGQEACRKGYPVMMDRTSELMQWLHAGTGDGTFMKRMEAIVEVPLLVMDDFGLIPMTPAQQVSMYEIICGRYEKASTIITSNRDFNEWISIFENGLIGSAAMDRLVHRATKLTIEGPSFRCFNFKNSLKDVQEKVAVSAEGG